MPPLSMVDPIFKVAMDARPSNYEVTHVSWERPADNLNWYRYVVVRSPHGYPKNPNDGEVIFPNYSGNWSANPSVTPLASIGFTDDVILRITAVNTGGVVASAQVQQSGAATNLTLTSVSPISTSGIKGKNLNVTITPASSWATINSGGGDYVVGDILRIPGNALKDPANSTETLPGVSSNTQLGVTNTFHLYDNGATYATTANPATSVGSNPYSKNYNKYYYSLFAYVAPSNSAYALPYIGNIITLISSGQNVAYTNFKWIKLGEASSVVVHKNATRSTKDILLDHIPNFYSGVGSANQNKDLSDFLSLFAFHLDIYLAETKAVFEMTNTELTDEVLLKQFLLQYGSELKQVSDLKQARKVLSNIVRNYSLSGSTLGLKNFIESYTGNAVKQIPGINLLPDYNTSSFVENIGKWYPFPGDNNSYDASYPYNYTLDPMTAAIYGTSPTEAMVAQLFDASLVGTTNINISPSSSFVGKLAYKTTTSGSALTNNYETVVIAQAITSTSSTTITVDDTSKLKLGAMPLVISGSGVFGPQTVITYIDKDGKTFKVNTPPSTALAINDKIAISNTLTAGILSLHPANTATQGTVTLYSGMRRGATATTSTVSATAVQYIAAVAPNIVKVGDYVSGHQSLAKNTKVIGIGSSVTNGIIIDKKLTGTIPTAHTLFFSSEPNRELSAAVDMIPVSPSMPYAFGAHFNANNGTTKSTVVGLDWYDINGNLISSSKNTASAPTSTVPYSNSDFAKTWYPNYVQDTSPSTAAYVTPTISVLNAEDSSRYCVDSAMLVRPVKIISKERSANVATLTTETPHNFFYDGSVGGIGGGKVAVNIPDDSSFNTTSAIITNVIQDDYGNYKFSYSNTGATVTATTTVGYAASFPMIIDTIGGKKYQFTAFQDARETTLEVVSERINMVLNPSFDYDTSSTYDWTAFASTGVSVVDTTPTTDAAFTGNKYLALEKPPTPSAIRTGISQSTFMKVIAGKAYSASCRIRNTTVVNGTAISIRIGIIWYDSTGSLISTDYGDTGSDKSGVWVQIKSENKVAPSNAVYAKLEVTTLPASTGLRGFDLDGVMFEQSEVVNPYFNGDFDGYNYLYTRDSMWEGLPGQSRSHIYSNRAINIDSIDNLTVKEINYA